MIPVIDVVELFEKIPRPERAGWAAIACYAVLGQVLLMSGAGDIDPRCWFHPEECRQQESKAPEQKRLKLVWLDRNGRGKECVCHLDYQVQGKPIIHFDPGPLVAESCDSDHPFQDVNWKPIPETCFTGPLCTVDGHVKGKEVQFRSARGDHFRLHCGEPNRR